MGLWTARTRSEPTMMFTPHQADAVRRALRVWRGWTRKPSAATGLDARLGAALADKGRARFTADQKDDVRSALVRPRRSKRTSASDLGAALRARGPPHDRRRRARRRRARDRAEVAQGRCDDGRPPAHSPGVPGHGGRRKVSAGPAPATAGTRCADCWLR